MHTSRQGSAYSMHTSRMYTGNTTSLALFPIVGGSGGRPWWSCIIFSWWHGPSSISCGLPGLRTRIWSGACMGILFMCYLFMNSHMSGWVTRGSSWQIMRHGRSWCKGTWGMQSQYIFWSGAPGGNYDAQVANQGGGEALLIDTFGRLLLPR